MRSRPNGLDAPGQHTSAYDLALFGRQTLGGKIGWTSAAGATYVGMAKRGGYTLVVTLLHCPALTEIDAAKQLLDWGFKVDGTISPVGALVGPRPSARLRLQPPPAPGARSGLRDHGGGRAWPAGAACRGVTRGRRRP